MVKLTGKGDNYGLVPNNFFFLTVIDIAVVFVGGELGRGDGAGVTRVPTSLAKF